MLQLAGSLFSGYGGLDLAVNKVFGTHTAWLSEFDAAPSKVLAHRFPGVPNLGDITKIIWPTVPYVQVMSGGSPCQDLSHAGPRTGMIAGTRSGLWESMREGIAVLRPQYVVWENVKGALSAKATSQSDVERESGRVGIRALGRVLGDLSSLGYDASWGTFRASDAGLPHRRERVFVVARFADASVHGPQGRGGLHSPGSSQGQDGGTPAAAGVPPHPDRITSGQRSGTNVVAGKGVPSSEGQPPPFAESGVGVAYDGYQGGVEGALVRYGPYAATITNAERLYGPAPDPLVPSMTKHGERLNPKFSEWVMGLEPGWVSDVPGISASETLKMTGNGVAPPQAELAIRTLLNRLEHNG